MEDGIFSPGAICSPSFAADMDCDYINELLDDECWLETVYGSDSVQQCSPDLTNMSKNSPFSWSPSDTFPCANIFGQTHVSSQVQCVMSSIPGGMSLNESQRGADRTAAIQAIEQELVNSAGCSGRSCYLINEMETSKRPWIGPRATAGPNISVTERLVQAIGYIKDSTKDRNVLIQMWGPRDLSGKRVLTTIDHPFIVDSSSTSLASYRSISLNFQFSADKNSNMFEGMPGRVFLGKVPEWTPDVRFYRSDEYARVSYAKTFNVCGTLALPVFDRGSQTCLGVIEVVTTTQTVKAELDSVCEALQAVDLSGTGSQSTKKPKACIQSYHAALPEILEVVKSACLTHNLPLAQTWMRCVKQGKEGFRHSKKNYIHCVSTVDSACYVSDPSVQGFHEACSEHHLLRGQGVAGKAFTTNEPCFYNDITSFCKTDYPLSHHARMFGLHAAVAICLRSVQTGVTDFVLEFFLPADCREPEEQKKMLGSLSLIIQKTCKGLCVVTDDELTMVSKSASASEVPLNDGIEVPKMIYQRSTTIIDQSHHAAPFIQKEEPTEFMYEKSALIQSNSQGSSFDYNIFGEESFGNLGVEGDKKRTKAENTITLEVLQRHFAGSLKDAAKNLGSIKRWPSRKIKKVGHSLEKLQSVIDSVQGPSGTFQIGSFYLNFPELASPSIKSEITHQFSASNLSTISKSLRVHHEVNAASRPTMSVSPASLCSQSSSSSHSCSSGSHHRTSSWNSTTSEDAATVKENSNDAVFKRMRSDVHLNRMGYEDPKLLPRSQSHVTLARTPNSERLPPLPKNIRKELDGTRVKVTYGDDKIRIRMQNHWQLKDLQNEIARRFNADASCEMQLKYLDDDSEWVLLTCDADWEECVDVCMSSSSNTIKLSLHSPPHHHGSYMVSSSPP